MNPPIDHLINSRTLTTFSDISTELRLNKEKNYLFDLSYLGVLNIDGDKSAEFLQGQLTCDINQLSDIHMIQGAQCNLKGRILALMDVIQWNGIKLVLPKDILEATQNSLSKTALLSRVQIKPNEDLRLFGFYLQNQKDIVPDSIFLPKEHYAQAQSTSFCYYHLGNGFYIFAVEKDVTEEFLAPFVDKNQLLGSLTWHSLRLNQHQLSIYPESRGLFLPHRLSLHQTQYLSFQKGCYKGQEIIARTHYRATLKHDLRLFTINTHEALYSGQKLFNSYDSQEIGELVDYSCIGVNSFLIAVSLLKEAAHEIRLEQQEHSVQLLTTALLYERPDRIG